jgi:hypothetical protein
MMSKTIKENSMKPKILCVLTLTLLLVGWGTTTDVLLGQGRVPQESRNDVRATHAEGAGAETLIVESLGSGTAADVYRLSCTAECIRADVNDTGPVNDTRFKVTVVGSSSNFVGDASAISPAGGLSLEAEVCSGSNVNSSRRAYVTITEVNAPGAEDYDSLMRCRRADGTFINPTIVKILDQ